MMKKVTFSFFSSIVVAVVLTSLSSCHKLSPLAREITGEWFITEISKTEPLLELREDGTITVRAVKPEVLTYSVSGEWNVENDSIIAALDISTLQWAGDSSLIGNVPADYRRRIVDHTEGTLTIERDGVKYIYQRGR